MSRKTDYGLENLLALDGDTYVIDEAGFWVKFEVKRVKPTAERPHGIQYSLTLHGPGNERLIGFDNAHAVKQSSGPVEEATLLTITGTDLGPFGRISTTMRSSCSMISGKPSIRF